LGLLRCSLRLLLLLLFLLLPSQLLPSLLLLLPQGRHCTRRLPPNPS